MTFPHRAARFGLSLLAVLALVAATAAAAAAAKHPQLISRQQATQVALRALRGEISRGSPRIFAMPRALKRGEYVYEAGWLASERVTPLSRPAWLFWEDRAPGAEYAHPSVLLLVDARTGKVVRRQSMLWFLYVDDKLAPFLRTTADYNSAKYVVYPARVKHGPRARAAGAGRRRATAANYAAAKNRSAALAQDCMVTIGDFKGPAGPTNFSGSKKAMDRFADAVGLVRKDVDPTGMHDEVIARLKATIGDLRNKGCRDVLLFLAGHGVNPVDYKASGQNKKLSQAQLQSLPANLHAPGAADTTPAVMVSPKFDRNGKQVLDKSVFITPADLIDVISGEKTNPRVEFKLKVDSCFAGRFRSVFDALDNVVVFEAASAANEASYTFAVAPGAFFGVADPHTGLIPPHPQVKRDNTDNPDGASSFVDANVHGLMQWAADAPASSTLLDGINMALDLGAPFDFARTISYTHPFGLKRAHTAEPSLSLYWGGPGADDGDFSIASSRRAGPPSRDAFAAQQTGSIAFTEASSAKIGFLDTAGNHTEFPTAPGAAPQQIAYGPDGNFWFTELDGTRAAIGRITPAGVVSTFDLPATTPQPFANLGYGIAAGPDGNLWFTERGGAKIGVMSTSGVLLHEYTVRATPPKFFQLYLIALGPDGNMWFTESDASVGRITPSGVVTEFPITAGRVAFGLGAGPDGKIWLALQGGIAGIGRINVDGTGYTEFADPDGGFPNQIAAGPDGNLWYSDYGTTSSGGDQIGRITPSGQITEYSTGLPADAQPTAITAGPDGRMWFTLSAANKVGAITTS